MYSQDVRNAILVHLNLARSGLYAGELPVTVPADLAVHIEALGWTLWTM